MDMQSCTRDTLLIKGTWEWGGFLGFSQKLVPHRSLTLPFEPFRFWLRIRGGKATPRLGYSPTRRVGESATLRLSNQGVHDSLTCRVGESAFECLTENSASRRVDDFQLGKSESRRLPDSTSGESLWWVRESLFKFFKIYHHYKQLNHPFKGPI